VVDSCNTCLGSNRRAGFGLRQEFLLRLFRYNQGTEFHKCPFKDHCSFVFQYLTQASAYLKFMAKGKIVFILIPRHDLQGPSMASSRFRSACGSGQSTSSLNSSKPTPNAA